MTNFPLRPLVAAVSLALTGLAQAAEGEPSIWSFSGFGTLSAVHSSDHESDFTGSLQQPNGAGRTQPTSFSPDSKLGGQFTGKFTPALSAVLQVVTQHQYNNGWMPQIEWANVQYQISPALRVRVGRIAMPTFMTSETRLVGYANPWVRPPQEVYGINTVTANDGVDASHVSRFGSAVNTLSGFFGTSKIYLPGDITHKAKPAWGLNDTLELGALTLRVGYVSTTLDILAPTSDRLQTGLKTFGAAASAGASASSKAAGAQAYSLADKYSFNGLSRQNVDVGISYDTGTWFVAGEYARLIANNAFPDSNSVYVTGGYRIGKWTPYATVARLKEVPLVEVGINTTGLSAQQKATAAGLNGNITRMLNGIGGSSQKSATLGLRWDFMKNAAVKLQYDHIALDDNSHGQMTNASPNSQAGGKVNLVSAALDFVF